MEQSKTMTDLQQEVDLYINSFKESYFPPMELMPD